MVNKWGAALLAVATVANAQKLLPISRSFGGGKVVKRGAVTFATDHELDMDYAEMGSYNSKDTDTFGATVHISTIDPAVQTEDFGNQVTDITCSGNNSMKITFANADAANQAKSQWITPSMTIITLTSTCNDDDVRVPWNVSKPVFDGSVATLAGKPSNWDTVSNGIYVSYGNQGNVTNPATTAQRTGGLHKRDDTATVSLDFDLSGKMIYPPEMFGNISLPVSIPDPTKGALEQYCTNCTHAGKAIFSSGTIDIKGAVKAEASAAVAKASGVAVSAVGAVTSAAAQAAATVVNGAENAASKVQSGVQSVETAITGGISSGIGSIGSILKRDDPFADIAQNIDDGTLKLDLEGMHGHFEFETDVYASKEFTVSMVPGGITISPLQIQGILSIGPKIDPTLVFKFDSEDPLSFSYGFEYTMPDGAGVEVNLLDPKSSKTDKFDQMHFNALPFSTTAKEVAASGLNYSIAFRPVFSVGVTVLEKEIEPFEMMFDVPKVSGNIAIAQNVDETCAATGGYDAFDVDASFTFDMGIGADIDLGVWSATPSAMLVSTTGLFPMKTCVPFHSSTGPADGGDSTDVDADVPLAKGDEVPDEDNDEGDDDDDDDSSDVSDSAAASTAAASSGPAQAASTPTAVASSVQATSAAAVKGTTPAPAATMTAAPVKGTTSAPAATLTAMAKRRHARSF